MCAGAAGSHRKSMHIYVYEYGDIYVYIYTYIYIGKYIYVYACIYKYIYVHTWKYMCTHPYIHVCILCVQNLKKNSSCTTRQKNIEVTTSQQKVATNTLIIFTKVKNLGDISPAICPHAQCTQLRSRSTDPTSKTRHKNG